MSDNTEKRIRRNKMNVEWAYAKSVWRALVAGEEIPPVPKYQVYESTPSGGERLIDEKLIEPMKVTYGGKVYFGSAGEP